jgi:galactose-3-O-sulfotransferase
MLIFLHIPKTGGSTLNPVLDWNYQDKSHMITRYTQIAPFINLSEKEKGQYRVLMGQIFFGIHQYIAQDCTYITMLRHPIKRLISQYHYINIRKEKLGESQSDMSIEQFLEIEAFQAYMQLNLIAGGDSLDEALRRPLPANALERAKINIEAHFPVVGIVNRYDESLLLMKQALGWKRAFYTRQNVNVGHPSFEDFSKATQRMIEQVCAPELALFEYAEKRLEMQLAEQDEAFWQELEQLKGANQRFSSFYRLAKPLRHTKLWFVLKKVARRLM